MPHNVTIDPVCGMRVDPATAKGNVQHDGRSYYFCCEGCATKFRTDPAAYLETRGKPPGMVMLGAIAQAEATAAAPAGQVAATYTCPMHPEVRQPRSQSCPKCGMVLEAERPGAAPTEYTCPMH